MDQQASVALLTQDAYSLSLDGAGRWQWTLLRSPKMAWFGDEWGKGAFVKSGRDYYTNQGEHSFAFTLLADSELSTTRIETAARQLAQPPIVFDRFDGMSGMSRTPWGDVPPPHLR